MRRAIILAFGLAVLVAPALADLFPAGPEVGPYVINLDGSLVTGGALRDPVNENYDNWRGTSSTPPGSSALLGLYKSGTHEIADDLNMVDVGAGWLNNMGFSVANVDAPGGLVTGAGEFAFYRQSDGTLIDAFAFNLPTFSTPLAALSSTRLTFGAGALTALNIFLPADIYASVTWTSATFDGAGGTVDNLGIQIRGPINTGTSTDLLIDVTAGSGFNFGGNPPANTALFIHSDFTPEPASLLLLALGGLLLRRR